MLARIPDRGRKTKTKLADGFPLWRHPSDRWTKKVRGHQFYFGRVSDDPEGKRALAEWLRVKDDLLAGRSPRAKVEGVTLRELCNYFLESKAAAVETRELQMFTFNEYHRACEILIKHFGPHRVAGDITPQDFTGLRIRIAKGIGLAEVGKRVQMIRSIFKYGTENGHIRTAVLFGSDFKRPSSKVMRRVRGEKPAKLFTAEEVRALIDAADHPLRSMILLGINAAYGQTDLATLPKSAVDLKKGWITHARPKTGAPRRCPLWPETRKALQEALAIRPKPKNDTDADLCFVTKYGNRWVKYMPSATKEGKGSWTDSIGLEFGKVLKTLKLEQSGRRFYSLRHTFRTIADRLPDRVSVDFIMGHLAPETDMRGRYVHEIPDDARLKAVAAHVRKWLFAGAKKTKAVETQEAK